MNLLNETLETLEENGKQEKDVLWVGDYELYFSWKSFKEVANKEYDSGFGGEEVNSELVVIGKDWWLERHEYDGSEWWEFKELPMKPKKLSISPKEIIFYD